MARDAAGHQAAAQPGLRRRPVARGVPIFRQGEAFSSVYAVRSGAVKTCLTLADGEEQITGFYLPGEIVGLDAIGQQRHGNTAVALESTSVCAIPFDQLEPLAGRISWISPVARALIKAREGDSVTLRTPGGVDELEILEVHYPEPLSR